MNVLFESLMFRAMAERVEGPVRVMSEGRDDEGYHFRVFEDRETHVSTLAFVRVRFDGTIDTMNPQTGTWQHAPSQSE